LAKLFSGLSPILDTSQNPFKKTLLGSMQSLKTFILEECKVSKLFFLGWANQPRPSPSKSFELWYAPITN
jgi:hypothetical protein